MNMNKQHTALKRDVQIVLVQSYLPGRLETKWAHIAIRGCSGVAAIRAAKRCLERRWHIPRRYLRAPFIYQSVA